MPTYEYECPQCQKTFEVFQKISAAPKKKCPDCGGRIKKLISPTAFRLKGGGWYKDGYAKKPPESKKTEKDTATADTAKADTAKAGTAKTAKSETTRPATEKTAGS